MSQDQFIHTLDRWIGVMMHNSMLNLTRYAREHGYSVQQLMTMYFIHRKGPCGVTDLGDHMGVTSAAASQLLERLVQQGLVLRTEDPNDRRGKLVALTEQGEQILDESMLARSRWLGELEAKLSAEEYTQAIHALNMLIDKARDLDRTSESAFGEIHQA